MTGICGSCGTYSIYHWEVKFVLKLKYPNRNRSNPCLYHYSMGFQQWRNLKIAANACNFRLKRTVVAKESCKDYFPRQKYYVLAIPRKCTIENFYCHFFVGGLLG